MYSSLLVFHSFVRWLVLISLTYATIRGYKGWFTKDQFTKRDYWLRAVTGIIAHTQLLLGLWLYFISPIVEQLLGNYKAAVKDREIRFFGMEHIMMMILAITILTVGSIL